MNTPATLTSPQPATRVLSSQQRSLNRYSKARNLRAIGHAVGCWVLLCCVVIFLASEQQIVAQDDADGKVDSGQSFTEQSVALRTALHHDPTLASPLERLVTLYQTAGKLQELVGLYRNHVGQYPNDPSGRTVLVRLLVATGDPGALTTAEAAVRQFPKSSKLHHILFQQLSARNDPKAIGELDLAIETETRPSRKLKWIEALLPLAQLTARRDMALKHLKAIASVPRTAEQRLEVGRLMNRYKYYDLALKLLTKTGDSPAPETMVDLELESATAEVGLDKVEVAATRLQTLLGRLTGDYWRRPDIVRRRLALVSSPEERSSIIAAAKKRVANNTRDEAAVLDLAQTLAALQFRREALDVLIKASEKMSNSEIIEQRTLDLFDRLRDERGREEYLAARIKLHPKRADLVLLRVKSLYVLGKQAQADPMFEQLIGSLSGKQQAEQVLEMARFLRRNSLTSESANLLERVLKLNPNRLDVRRELAEIRLALGQRHKVSEAFKGAISSDAAIEDVLDLVQFMLQQKRFVEASDLLRERLKVNKTNLELRLLLVSVERRMGRLTGGTRLLEECRELADTGARYRAWLEAAAAFFDEFDAIDGFMKAELQRIQDEQGVWSERQLERRLAFAEVASSNGLETETARMLKQDLAGDLPPLMKLAIRRVLIDVLKDDRNQYQLVEEELNSLAKEDPQSISEYSARLALLHKEQNREDRAMQFLKQIVPSQIREPSILSSLLTAFQNRTDQQQFLIEVLERLTVVNPGDRGNWERWLTVLAATGDEERLRVELRRLLSGVKELTLDEKTRNLLQLYVADSYWRSISKQLGAGQRGHLSEILPHLDAIERMARNDQQWLWMTWIRAHVLNKLGNETARDEAIVELERVLKTHTVVSPDGGVAPISPRIVFPDGVSISTARARELLSQPFQSAAPAALSDATGLMPGFKARWSWKANGSNISALRPIGKNRILIGEYSGALSCVDSISGKVLWSRDDVIPRFQPSGGERYSNPSEIVSVMGRSGFQVVPLAGSVEGGDADRFCLGGLGCVSCYSLKDGQLLWQADVGANAHKPGAKRPIPVFTQAAVNVFAIPGKPELVTWDSASSTLARIDPSSGKLLWYHVVKTASPGRTVATNSGASLHGNRLLVYGPMTAIIDITNGETVWSFEAHKLRSFPVSLQKQKKPQTNTPITPITSISPILFGGSSHIHWPAQTPQPPLIYPRRNPWQFNRQRPLTITSSAVQWAANAQRGTLSYAELQGSRVLLYQNYTVHTVELDLPLATKTNGLVGYLFGKVGRTTCTLASSIATFTNLNNASVKSHPLTDLLPVPGKVMSVPIQATTDGLLAYVTGQRGIQCINIKSGELVFQVPWPKSVAPEVVTSTVVAVAQPFGYSPSRSINLSSANPYQPPNPGAQRNPTANCSLACISNGILFTLTAADTVVALEGATVDGR